MKNIITLGKLVIKLDAIAYIDTEIRRFNNGSWFFNIYFIGGDILEYQHESNLSVLDDLKLLLKRLEG